MRTKACAFTSRRAVYCALRLSLVTVAAIVATPVLADECPIPIETIKEQMIRESVSRYPGSCPCPYFTDRAGRRCGKRSAWDRAGGYQPLCFPADISPDMVREFCEMVVRFRR